MLSFYYWAFVYKQSFVDTVIKQLNSVVIDSLSRSIPYTCNRKLKFTCCFSGILRHYIKRKVTTSFFIIKHTVIPFTFSWICKLLTTTGNAVWSLLRTISSQPSFGNTFIILKGITHICIQITMDDQPVTELKDTAYALSIILNLFLTQLARLFSYAILFSHDRSFTYGKLAGL
jgi:hypothetical protein